MYPFPALTKNENRLQVVLQLPENTEYLQAISSIAELRWSNQIIASDQGFIPNDWCGAPLVAACKILKG